MSHEPAAALARSVIICCYTDERWDLLEEGLAAVAAQLRPPDELIVVVDHNEALLRRVRSRHGAIARVMPSRGAPGLSDARNTGVAAAHNDLVVFLDDDARPEGGWLDAMTAPFHAPDVVGVGGVAAPSWEGPAPPWMPAEFLWVVGCSYVGLPEHPADIRNPIGCTMAFRRNVVTTVGGFSPTLGRVGRRPVGGEETDLAIRVRAATGGVVRHAPEARVAHAVPAARARIGYFVSRCYAEGRSKAILAGRVGTMSATEAERSYLVTLARGGITRMGRAIDERSVLPLIQIGVLALGLIVTGTGFVAGLLQEKAGVLLRLREGR